MLLDIQGDVNAIKNTMNKLEKLLDEEKAEEYIMREDVDTMKYSECYDERVYFEKEVKKAYLDGLAEGRKEKWHDLRKDPNDLPKEKGEYRICFYDSELKANRNVNWYYYGKSWAYRIDVIAWCEIPIFKE